MADFYTALADITGALSETLKDCGFTAVIPDGIEKGELPAVTESGRIIIRYKGENKALKIEHFNNKIALFGAQKEGEVAENDYSKLIETLLGEEDCEPRNLKSVANQLSETLVETFGTKTIKPAKTKLPPPVSKAAVKSGAVSYDPNTLANRFTTVYPELREEYKANCDRYGQFLAEDFFINHGAPVVMATIRENNPQKMKKLFNLLNDIYDDGTSETQGLVAVTILGSLHSEAGLLDNCVEYMSDDMKDIVININKYLGSKSGKGATMRLENPPKYKPGKDKKKGAMNRLGM